MTSYSEFCSTYNFRLREFSAIVSKSSKCLNNSILESQLSNTGNLCRFESRFNLIRNLNSRVRFRSGKVVKSGFSQRWN